MTSGRRHPGQASTITEDSKRSTITQNASIGIAVSVIGYLLFATVHNYWGYYGAAFIIGLGNGHMFPAFQSMFINLAPNERRGTANSTLYVSWDTGFGLGVLFITLIFYLIVIILFVIIKRYSNGTL